MTKAEYLQTVVQNYIDDGQTWPAPLRAVARWAIQRNLWKAPLELVESKCAEDLATALRSEHAYDPQGRKIRTKHAAIDPKHPEQGVLWADIRTASEEHMQRSFEMRRSQIIGDCKQLKLDLDSFNENRKPVTPIQMNFDFTSDLNYQPTFNDHSNEYRSAHH
jgi:hypothetical protein